MSPRHKPLVWLHGEVKTPPLTQAARIEAGYLLRQLQGGKALGLPHSRPMSTIGSGCHELRIVDQDSTWRVIYHIAPEAIVILDVFSKKTTNTPRSSIVASRRRLKGYQDA